MAFMASATGAGCGPDPGEETSATPAQQIPTFRADAGWPEVPAQWRLGEVSSIGIDARDNAWLLHRPWTLDPSEAHLAAPQVLNKRNSFHMGLSCGYRVGK